MVWGTQAQGFSLLFIYSPNLCSFILTGNGLEEPGARMIFLCQIVVEGLSVAGHLFRGVKLDVRFQKY